MHGQSVSLEQNLDFMQCYIDCTWDEIKRSEISY